MDPEQERLEQIYKEYHGKVQSWLNGKLNNSVLAEDLCAAVFLKVCEKLCSFDETKASMSTWIFTISRNTLTDFFRTHREYSEIPEDLAEDSDIEESYFRSEELSALSDALEALPQRERDIIILHYYSGKKLKDIAVTLGISYAYVKLLHNKALESMRKFF